MKVTIINPDWSKKVSRAFLTLLLSMLATQLWAQTKICNAHFYYQTGNLSNTVYFASSQNPYGTQYSWTFGDGGISNLPNPNHTYASSGTYYVCLTVTVSTLYGNCKDTWCDSIKITVPPPPPPPVCDAHFKYQTGNTLGGIFFYSAPNPYGTHYSWTFGDGGTSTQLNPFHQYANSGTYYVCLTVTDSTSSGSCTATWCDSVKVTAPPPPPPPVCDARFKYQTGNTLGSIFFYSAPNPYGSHYSWTFGDGGTSTQPNPVHQYTTSGTYYVCLTVTDSTSSGTCKDTYCDSVKVTLPPPPPPPVCDAHFKYQTGNTLGSVFFFSAPNPYGSHYSWTFGDGGTSTQPNPVHQYTTSGTYYVCLTVTDSTSSGTCKDTYCDSVKVTLPPPPPPPVCDAHFKYQTGSTLGGIFFYSAPNPYGTHYSWTFGDGGTSTQPNPFHQYANGGTYYVCLTVTDSTSSGSCTATWCDSVKVTAPPPPPPPVCNAHFKYQPGNTAGSIIFFSSLNPPGTQYFWTFGDGGTSTQPNPGHLYTKSGTYYVCLTVKVSTLSGTCTDTWCDSVFVKLPPPPPAPICNAHFKHYRGFNYNGIYFVSAPNPPGSKYFWTFGDGGTSTQPNPNHVYANQGTYYVCLTVTASNLSGNCTSTWCDSVKVGPPPPPPTHHSFCKANFKAFRTSFSSLTVYFQSALNAPGTNYSWTFGDGDTSSLINPIHTYASAGTYTVCLTVSRITPKDTCKAKFCQKIIVKKFPMMNAAATSNDEKLYELGTEEEISVQVYPNPASDYANVSIINTTNPVTFKMYDLTGKLVFERNDLTDGNFNITTSEIRPGLYFYMVNDDSQIIANGKLIVQ